MSMMSAWEGIPCVRGSRPIVGTGLHFEVGPECRALNAGETEILIDGIRVGEGRVGVPGEMDHLGVLLHERNQILPGAVPFRRYVNRVLNAMVGKDENRLTAGSCSF